MKSLILIPIFTLLSIQALASGCDWQADGSPYIERIEVIRDYELSSPDVIFGCAAYGSTNCIMQLMVQGNPNVFRKESSSGGEFQIYHEVVPNSDFEELIQARDNKLLIIKMIWENVYGFFDDNCAGPYPPLKSGRFHLQLIHKESQKKWDFYFVSWLQPTNMLPLF